MKTEYGSTLDLKILNVIFLMKLLYILENVINP